MKCRRRRNRRRRLRGSKGNFASLKLRVRATKAGRRVWSIANRFWKLKEPVAITAMKLPRRYRNDVPLAFLGQVPEVKVANGKKGQATRESTLRLTAKHVLVGDHTRKKFAIINLAKGLPDRPRLKQIGWASQTDYLPPRDLINSGSPKSNTLWEHKHSDEGGRFPKLFQDQNGNLFYGPSTFAVKGLWLRR